MTTVLQIRMCLAFAVSPDPEAMFTAQEWRSPAAQDARVWMMEQGLIDHDGEASAKLLAYVEYLKAVPLPVIKWVLPDVSGQ